MNLNKVFLIGRLTADPELRTTPSGHSVATFSLATNRTWTSKQGQKQDETQFHNVVVWGRQAEIANQFLKKGSLAFMEGRLQTRKWQDKQGQNRFTTEIVCEHIQLGPRPGGFNQTATNSFSEEQRQNDVHSDEIKDELPQINLEDEVKPEDIPF